MKSILTVCCEGEAPKPNAQGFKPPPGGVSPECNQTENRGSQRCLDIHVLVFLMHVSMDSVGTSGHMEAELECFHP